MFSVRNYCGDLELLGVFLKITIHVTFLYIKFGYARRHRYEPWVHGICYECLNYYHVSHMFFHITATFALKAKSHNPKHLRSGVESRS